MRLLVLLPVPEESNDDDSQKHNRLQIHFPAFSSLSPAEWSALDADAVDDDDVDDDGGVVNGGQSQISHNSASYGDFSGFTFSIPLLTQAPYKDPSSQSQ